jgi:bifunctional NMN adenylyltransferase/nudix hydrolase
MIRAVFPEDSPRLVIRPLRDHLYNDALWIAAVQRLVAEANSAVPAARIGLIGHRNEETSGYLDMFPQWEPVAAVHVPGISAADLREDLLAGNSGWLSLMKAALPAPVCAMLEDFREGPHFAALVREHQFIKAYRKGWATAPYEPSFVTVDAVVVHSGHVLLIRRGADPGKGLWAFPGGFVDPNETLKTAVIRELREETQLQLSAPVLLGSIKNHEVFDHPQRSQRGRTFTHAFFFAFPAGVLPPVKGNDDAEHAQWLPISAVMEMEEQFFEDHFHILEYFIGCS